MKPTRTIAERRLYHRDYMRARREKERQDPTITRNPVGAPAGPRLDRFVTWEALGVAARNSCAFIMLGNRKFALIDEEDLDRVSEFNWWVNKDCETRQYAQTQIGFGKGRLSMSLHRFVSGANAPHVDHKDHNGLNNQKGNLRPCCSLNNHRNRLPQKHSSRFKGVTLMRRAKNPWLSRIRVNKKIVHLGMFSDEREAGLAYDDAALKYFGEFAFTNHQAGLL